MYLPSLLFYIVIIFFHISFQYQFFHAFSIEIYCLKFILLLLREVRLKNQNT